jgi:hypothetical protein
MALTFGSVPSVKSRDSRGQETMSFVQAQHIIMAVAVLVIGLGVTEGPGAARADAQSGPFATICALKEIKVITLIEEHGAAADLVSDRLGDAGLAMLRARMACYQGRVAEAVALYDEILSLGPVRSADRR